MNDKLPPEKTKKSRARIIAGILAGPVLMVVAISAWFLFFQDFESSEYNIVPATHLNPESKQPGLLVRFTRPGLTQSDVRTSRLAALFVEADASPTPFLDPGPFEAEWEGVLHVAEEDEYQFYFEGTGRAELKLGGENILQASGSAESEPVRLGKGFYELQLRYQSSESGPARVRLLWSGSLFIPEPLPPKALSHNGTEEALANSNQLRRGRELITRYSCLKCHSPEDPAFFDGNKMPELKRDAPDLSEVGSRLRAGWMKQWMENPHSLRPSATMPHMDFTPQEAADIAAWLSTLGEPPDETESSFQEGPGLISTGERLYTSLGCIACHTLDANNNDEERLSLAGIAGKWYPPALAEFLGEPARHYRWTRMPDFHLDEEEAAAITAFLISAADSEAAPESISGDIHKGERLVQIHGCASCHAMPAENLLESPSWETILADDWQRGWLGNEAGSGNHPSYPALSQSDIDALKAFAAEGAESLKRFTPIEFAARQVMELDCRACHVIDGQADRWSMLTDEEEPADVDSEDQTLMERPPLTWTGEKLQPEWFGNLLAGSLEFEARPWMDARMPATGAKPDLLARGMIESHGFDGVNFRHIRPDPEMIAIGRRLSTDIGGGFGCNFCHGGREDLDMYQFGDRLRPEYFYWKMWTPSRVDSLSAMPQFGSLRDGRTRLRDTVDGIAEVQFEAIWHFFVENRLSQRDPDAESVVTRWDELYRQMDTGPFFSRAMEVPEGNPEPKGLAIRVGDQQQAAVHFDQDLLRMSAGWSGDFLNFRSNHDWGTRNSRPPAAGGVMKFLNPAVSGWNIAGNPLNFTDIREEPFGPIPEEHGRYEGIYLHGNRVVLSYTVSGVSVLESPWYVEHSQTGAFVRDLKIGSHDQPLAVLLFDSEDEPVQIQSQSILQTARSGQNGNITVAALPGENAAELAVTEEGHVALQLEPHDEERTVRVLIWNGNAADETSFLELASANGTPDDVRSLTDPGPPLWGEPLVTRGEIGENDTAYIADKITAPVENPYDALLHFTGLDFMEDGRAVLSTIHGDVWLVDGLNDSLEQITWQRFATGLNMPFGVKVVDGKIYVSNEDELTILHDRNGNGEADFYENFQNLITPGAGGWNQAFGLEADSEGNFYFVRGRGSRLSDYRNGVIRVSADGSRMDLIASGFRQPFGMGISPDGLVTVSQQEGTWVPQTPVHIIDPETRKGSFYGYQPGQFRTEDPYPREIGYEPPILWLPRNIDNSGGGQVWVDSDSWGLPRGQMLHLSYGRGTINKIMYETVDGDRQGAVVPLGRVSSRLRVGRFHPDDGHLYVAGLSPEGFQRVRYTGEPLYLPTDVHAHENGLRIRFSQPLNPETADDVSNFQVQRWNYRWSREYGSEFYSVENPDLMGEDEVDVTSVNISDDSMEIFLEIPGMVPVMQMRISYNLTASDGTPMQEDIYNTVNALNPIFDP
ncbi:MAG: c-type cytochrome [Balneolaceae bacterium]|nr:c-type cytochrome [Balneolaceae bacterium]